MGCYNCGSEEGSGSRLCPKCIEERTRARATQNITQISERKGSSGTKLPIVIIGAVLMVAITVCGGYYFLFSEDGPGYALPKYVRAENICKKIVQSKIKENKQKYNQRNFNDEIEEGMAELAAGLNNAMTEAMCPVLVQLCKEQPNKCDEMIESLKKF